MAEYGDQVWVAEGVYYPDEGAGQTNDVVSSTFELVDGVGLYGGFDPDLEANTFEARNWEQHVTVLSGDIDHETYPDISDPDGVITTTEHITGTNSHHVVTSIGVSEATRIDGFTITAGDYEIPNANASGGGMFNTDYSRPFISNIVLVGNRANGAGGMINLFSSVPTLSNVIFLRNSAASGAGMVNFVGYLEPTIVMTDVQFIGNVWGGLYNYMSNVKITNGLFWGNISEHGGGILSHEGLLNLDNVVFNGNAAPYYGGGMRAYDYALTMTNVIFSGNYAAQRGGGLYLGTLGAISITNLTLVHNYAPEGGGIYNENLDRQVLRNTIVWGNTAITGTQVWNWEDNRLVFDHSLIQDSGGSGAGWDAAIGVDGGGNIDADPLFCRDPDPGWLAWEELDFGDLHLLPGSPAIDAGTNTACPATDLDGWPRPIGLLCDMGAYEYRLSFYLPLVVR